MSNGAPLLSVITAVLNAADTLERTLLSVADLRSGERAWDIEHIIVDGGSTDGSLDLIERHRPNIAAVVTDDGRGISAAFNLGLAQARGRYVAILNADDTYSAQGMDAILTLLSDAPNEDVVYYANVVQLDPETGQRFPRRATIEPINRYMSLYHLALFVPSSVYQQLGGYEPAFTLAMDCEFVHRALAAGVTFQHADEWAGVMLLRGRSHINVHAAMAEFERSVVQHKLQHPLVARLYRWRQSLFHTLHKFEWFQRLWGLRGSAQTAAGSANLP